MQYRNGMRRSVMMAMVAASAALVMTGCQPDDDGSGTDESSSSAPSVSKSPSGSPSSGSTGSGTPSSGSTSSASPSSGGTDPATHGPSSTPTTAPSTGSSSGATCADSSLDLTAYQAADRPDGTGTGAAIIEFTNTSGAECVLNGHPTVAGAGNGSPDHNTPLTVTPTGSATPVRVAPGGKAWVKLTFVQVQGEADGYCESGADPSSYPTLVIGLPGSGAHQVALDDGVFAECDNTVSATAVTATKPS
ncbi:DUF4232 domain-containing protein [Streptomyces sp. SAS_270]|uniref:DUF4232 domain-containing protein n=1 Tax=Streptomyces sp. SAS_270 TaxID=3412748 RepID=UPI00403D1A8B